MCGYKNCDGGRRYNVIQHVSQWPTWFSQSALDKSVKKKTRISPPFPDKYGKAKIYYAGSMTTIAEVPQQSPV